MLPFRESGPTREPQPQKDLVVGGKRNFHVCRGGQVSFPKGGKLSPQLTQQR